MSTQYSCKLLTAFLKHDSKGSALEMTNCTCTKTHTDFLKGAVTNFKEKKNL